MAGKLVITVSDLHLGRANFQDDFRSDRAFRRFLETLNSRVIERDVELDLVLNGDVLDLWEISRDEELDPEDGQEAVGDLLGRRLQDAGAVADQRGLWQIDRAAEAHPDVFRAVGTLLAREENRVHYLPGNHDHAMHGPALQARFREAVDEATPIDLAGTVRFARWFRDTELGVYVEHGSQFAGNDSRPPDVEDHTSEPAGYYALLYIWNRVQANWERPTAQVLDDAFATLVSHILDDLPAGDPFFRFLLHYFQALDAGLVPEVVDMAGLPAMYARWESESEDERRLPSGFSALKDIFRGLFEGGEEGRPYRASHDWNPGSYPVRNVSWLPGGRTLAFLSDHGPVDRYWEGAMSRFTDHRDAGLYPVLDPATDHTVFLGHTHKEAFRSLPVEGGEGNRYFNTGSWTRGHPRIYGYATDAGGGDVRVWRGLMRF